MSIYLLHFEILKKTKKTTNALNDKCITTYGKCRAVRPLILKILKKFNNLEEKIQWSGFIRVVYNKLIKDFLPVVDKEILELEDAASKGIILHTYWNGEKYIQENYLKKFKKNLLKLKKRCEDYTINYYNYLPGNKLPLDVRSNIISFISLVPMEY
tara:strand:+ start:1285 stop:1752 length:468 start_codon:yes stop_codon:yes gene_type:complete